MGFRYVSGALKLVDRTGSASIEVRQPVQDAFQAEIQSRLADGIWSTGGCDSWYLDSHGVNRTIWPGFTWRYWMRTREIASADFDLAV